MIDGRPVARIAGRGAAALEPQMFGYAPVEAAERSRYDVPESWVRWARWNSTRHSPCRAWCTSTPGM